jgi:uncharacterized protein (TIGR00369 family)
VAFVRCAAEELFGVEVSLGDGATTSRMPVGTWAAGPDAPVAVGALGVLVDDTCGYAVNGARPGGAWSSTTELSLSVLRPLPTSGLVHAAGAVVGLGPHGGVGRTEVRDEAGELVAFAHGRNRFVGETPPADVVAAGRREHGLHLPPPGTTADLLELLGDLELDEAGAGLLVGPRLGNPRGSLHGGVSLCLADLLAAYAVPGLGTTGAVVRYLRPVPLGTRLRLDTAVRHRGRTLAHVEVAARREDGAECVRAVVTREQLSDPGDLSGAAPSRR